MKNTGALGQLRLKHQKCRVSGVILLVFSIASCRAVTKDI
jgi:hypothetical protein